MSETMWTDYPVEELGDEPGKLAPVRRGLVLGYDGDKYVDADVHGVRLFIKRGYCYSQPGRLGEVTCLTHEALVRAFPANHRRTT